ncbi:MAG: F0F1 ATP synthase subunit delta [Patescibacteria group bacterium]|nr:F0F1 ATP synthase subunit delta [Patescibacteria group bacterium]
MSKISTKNIALSIYEITKNKSGQDLEDVLIKIVKFLDKKRLFSKASDILKKLEELINKEEGIVGVRITYKQKPDKSISEKLEELLKKKYSANKLEIIENENKKILGGIKIEVEDEVIDLTLKNKMNQLQNYLITN